LFGSPRAKPEGSIALGEEFTIITKELDEAQLILSKTQKEGEDGKKKDDRKGGGGRKESTFRNAGKKAKDSVAKLPVLIRKLGATDVKRLEKTSSRLLLQLNSVCNFLQMRAALLAAEATQVAQPTQPTPAVLQTSRASRRASRSHEQVSFSTVLDTSQ
jgi:hypothetical protein